MMQGWNDGWNDEWKDGWDDSGGYDMNWAAAVSACGRNTRGVSNKEWRQAWRMTSYSYDIL